MDASTNGRKAEEAHMNSTPDYNSGSVKKARLESTLVALLSDPVLTDVPKKPSLSDVDTLINLELGSAMRITIRKLDGSSFEVPMMNSATVKDLKLAIKRKVNDMEESKMGHRHISWKHVWANFCLSYHNEKLLDDNSSLQDYGIRNNTEGEYCQALSILRVQNAKMFIQGYKVQRECISRVQRVNHPCYSRCNSFLMLFQELQEGTRKAENTVFFVV